ncbi:MAG TPA: DUF4386 domain-containing protein [Candidatus Acidoferrales bacterium]|nr:DUF4386 domain-containing protein [Candidatus Acidoferrales bacterium]
MTSVRAYARLIGILVIVSLVAGGFGEAFVPSQLLVSGDAAATAHNITTSGSLFRLGFAGYLIEAMCDIALTLLLYALLRPVREDVALLAVFFRLVATAVFAGTELFYAGTLLILGGADYLKVFTPEQLDALALLSLRFYGYGSGLFNVFYGVGLLLFGYLIVRSRYLPAWLGGLVALAGAGFVLGNFVLVLAPAYSSPLLLIPTFVGVPALSLWLLIRGVDVQVWEATRSRPANAM